MHRQAELSLQYCTESCARRTFCTSCDGSTMGLAACQTSRHAFTAHDFKTANMPTIHTAMFRSRRNCPSYLSHLCLFSAAAFATDTTTASAVPEATADATVDSAVPVATAAVATVKTPAATAAPTPTPTIKVPAPFTVQDTVNTTTDNSTDSADTALYSVLRIIGSEVTPFNLARQSTLLNALGQVISTVDFANISISDVNPVYSLSSLRRRRVLLEATSHQVGHLRQSFCGHTDTRQFLTSLICCCTMHQPGGFDQLQTNVTAVWCNHSFFTATL